MTRKKFIAYYQNTGAGNPKMPLLVIKASNFTTFCEKIFTKTEVILQSRKVDNTSV